jgi:hypothetical protein
MRSEEAHSAHVLLWGSIPIYGLGQHTSALQQLIQDLGVRRSTIPWPMQPWIAQAQYPLQRDVCHDRLR